MDNSKSPHGVYKNPRLMHACTTIVGFTVHLQTKDDQVWEGIFNTFSEEFTVCLDLAVLINPKLDSKDCLYQALKSGLQAKEKALFDLKDIVRITVVDVDLNYATKELDKINTDADISGFNSSRAGEARELESWQDDDGDNPIDDSLLSLDEVATVNKNGGQKSGCTGWDPADMFLFNEQVHKVSTSYDDGLKDYTIPLQKPKNEREWRKKQERAMAIAREIENNPQSQGRLAKEDGSDDEEEKFSAVVRPSANQQPPQQQAPQQQSSSTIVEHNQSSPHPQQSHQHQQSPQLNQPSQIPHQQQQHLHQHQHLHHQQPQHQHPSQHQRQLPNRNINNGTHNKNFRNPRYDRRIDSLKNFGKALTLAPSPRPMQGPPNQMQGSPINSQNQSSSPQQSHQQKQTKQLPLGSQSQAQLQSPNQQQSQQQQHQQPQQQQSQAHGQASQPQQPLHQPHHHQSQHQGQNQSQTHHQQPHPSPQQTQVTSGAPATNATTTAPTTDTSVTSERSDTGSSLSGSQTKDQSEIARKSKLNPNAKEFVYKPRSPAIQAAQTNGANPTNASGTIDPANPSPMSQATHGPYYQQVPLFPHGLSPHQQPHHAAQFMPNHAHMHAFHQSQIHYMPTPMAPHFAPQQMSPRYIRSNFQNYHHRGGEHMGNVRAAYSQASMVAPSNAAVQQYVPPQSGAPPQPMGGYATASPQQQMIYSGPPQSVYPMGVPSGFHQHMQHVPNPPPYDGNAVYMPPSQNYVVNPQQ